MSGVFAQWQPAYAEAGIATFPVDAERKKPAVGNPLKGRLRASAQWALKFPEMNALGFACGATSGVTVVDIDEAGDAPVADVIAKLGSTPIIVRTASGKHHLWYRYAGEPRSPRKLARQMGLTGPVDILGDRGFVIAPPSQKAGGAYVWAQGTLADLASLPSIRLPRPGVANDAFDGPHSVSGSEPLGEGQRNDLLFRACLKAARNSGTLAGLLHYAHELNGAGQWAPLPVDEVERAVASAWRYQEEGRNLAGKGQAVVLSGDETAILERDPDGLYLYTMLRKQHWGRHFVVANEWRNHLASGAWTRPRFAAARQFLIDTGLIVEVRPAKKGVGPALYRFSSPLAVAQGRQGGGV